MNSMTPRFVIRPFSFSVHHKYAYVDELIDNSVCQVYVALEINYNSNKSIFKMQEYSNYS